MDGAKKDSLVLIVAFAVENEREVPSIIFAGKPICAFTINSAAALFTQTINTMIVWPTAFIYIATNLFIHSNVAFKVVKTKEKVLKQKPKS